MMQTENKDTFKEVTNDGKKEETKKRKVVLFIIFFIILIIVLLIILFVFKTKKDNTSNETTTENVQIEEEDTLNTNSEDSQIEDETPSCAPIYADGEIVSHTSTDTTWSYYFNEATSESILEYVGNLKTNGWSVISEKTIVNTSFWDLQKENCYISLRYHSTDNGVILEIKEETN